MTARAAVLASLTFLFPADVLGQASSHKYFSAGSALGSDLAHPVIVFGGEKVWAQGAAIGGDIGAVLWPGGSGTLISVTGGVRPSRPRRFEPFASAGLALVNAAAGWTAGGGVNWWSSPRFGLRVDVRFVAPFGGGEGGFAVLRAGLALR